VSVVRDQAETGVEVPPALAEAPLVRPERRGSWARRTAAAVIPPLVFFAVLIGVWYFVSYRLLSDRRRFLLEPPHQVVDVAFLDWDNFSELLEGLWTSVRVAGLGLLITIGLGVALAVVMSQARVIERAVFPLLVALQATPILAMVPLIALWWDTGVKSRVIVCILIAFFPIVLNTLFGLHSADPGLHDLITLHRGSRWARLRKVMLPAALPAMFAGLRIAAGLAVIGAIVGDFFFGRGAIGLGQLIRRYVSNTDGEQMLAAVILASLLGVTVFWMFGAIQNLAIGRWHDVRSGGGH
jgi:NitT/TauT family transport system permease protein